MITEHSAFTVGGAVVRVTEILPFIEKQVRTPPSLLAPELRPARVTM